MRLIWSETAIYDLNCIYDFYLEKNQKVAEKFYNGIIDDAAILISHPYIAPIEPKFDDVEYLVRGLVVRKGLFKIIYFINEKDDIYIARVRCCRQNPDDLTIAP